MRLEIARLWNGAPADEHEHVELLLRAEAPGLLLEVDASFHDDAPPATPPGSTPGLFNHEVVELFLFSDDERYLEVELGPFGHHLVLELAAPRRVARRVTLFDYPEPQISARRWRARVWIQLELIPPRVAYVNAHSVHGSGPDRRYLSAHPNTGPRPDFHRKDCAMPLEPELRALLRC